MMENFPHILQRLSIETCTFSSSDHFGSTSPFKVQVNFDIHVFEGQIDAEALDKWLNMLEGYFSSHNFSKREKTTFALLKSLSHVKHWWETYWEKSSTEESRIYCSTTQVFQQRTNTFSNHSQNQIKDQHTDVFTW